jgi:hypothetical protein
MILSGTAGYYKDNKKAYKDRINIQGIQVQWQFDYIDSEFLNNSA